MRIEPGKLAALLREAGLSSQPVKMELLDATTNHAWRVTLSSGTTVILKDYQAPDRHATRKKLRYVSALLAQHGIRVPCVLATRERNGVYTELVEYLVGIPLSHAQTLPPTERAVAWRDVGRMVRRVHAIAFPPRNVGEIVGDQVVAFSPPTWGDYLTDGTEETVRQLCRRLDLSWSAIRPRLRGVLPKARESLADVPARLLHNDLHPDNILIRSTPAGWVCAGIIDWEFARVGEPWWDVTRFDFRPAGRVPPAFYEGYGSRPSDAMAGIYELIHVLWRADAIVHNGQNFGGWPPTDAVLTYLRALDQHLRKLQSLV